MLFSIVLSTVNANTNAGCYDVAGETGIWAKRRYLSFGLWYAFFFQLSFLLTYTIFYSIIHNKRDRWELHLLGCR